MPRVVLTTEKMNMKTRRTSVVRHATKRNSCGIVSSAAVPEDWQMLVKWLSHRFFMLFLMAGLMGISLCAGSSAAGTTSSSAQAQEGKGTVSGRVMDPAKAALQGAREELQPTGLTAVSDSQGQ